MKPGSSPWFELHERDEIGRPGMLGSAGRLGSANALVGTAAGALAAPARPALASAQPIAIVAVKRFVVNMLSLSLCCVVLRRFCESARSTMAAGRVRLAGQGDGFSLYFAVAQR
jgi:hypothetical protein